MAARRGDRVTSLRLYPTVISYMQAWGSSPFDDTAIAARMQRLCAKLGTSAQ
jgi:hypothetical protein